MKVTSIMQIQFFANHLHVQVSGSENMQTYAHMRHGMATFFDCFPFDCSSARGIVSSTASSQKMSACLVLSFNQSTAPLSDLAVSKT